MVMFEFLVIGDRVIRVNKESGEAWILSYWNKSWEKVEG